MPFRLWLRKAACQRLAKLREQHIDAARRSVRRELPLPERSSLNLAMRLLDSGTSPSQRMARQELATQVRQALGGLGEIDREVLLMRYVEKLSYDDIGQVLDLEPSAVSKRHARALVKLQKILLEHGLGGSM
jgi:RNA polymerase sigma-70 factor (ECF subfamily)